MEFQREITNENVKQKHSNKFVVRNTKGDGEARAWSYFSSNCPTIRSWPRSGSVIERRSSLLFLFLLDSFPVSQSLEGVVGHVNGWDWV